MDPRWLFPLIAVVLAVLALRARGRPGGAARTWGLMALIFGAVSAWLHLT